MTRIHKTFYNAHFETRQYLQSYFKVLIDKKGRILKFLDAFLSVLLYSLPLFMSTHLLWPEAIF